MPRKIRSLNKNSPIRYTRFSPNWTACHLVRTTSRRTFGSIRKTFFADDILTKSDRMSMAHSVEVRPPFLDQSSCRVCRQTPRLPEDPRYATESASQGIDERQAPSGHPATQENRFRYSPRTTGSAGPLRGLLTDSLRYGASECGELFHSEVINTFLQRHLAKKANVGYHLWGLMVLFLWMKKWRIQAASSETPGALAQARVEHRFDVLGLLAKNCRDFYVSFAHVSGLQNLTCKCPSLQARILDWGRWKLFPRFFFPSL